MLNMMNLWPGTCFTTRADEDRIGAVSEITELLHLVGFQQHFSLRMASDVISEHLILINFIGGHAPRLPVVWPAYDHQRLSWTN